MNFPKVLSSSWEAQTAREAAGWWFPLARCLIGSLPQHCLTAMCWASSHPTHNLIVVFTGLGQRLVAGPPSPSQMLCLVFSRCTINASWNLSDSLRKKNTHCPGTETGHRQDKHEIKERSIFGLKKTSSLGKIGTLNRLGLLQPGT